MKNLSISNLLILITVLLLVSVFFSFKNNIPYDRTISIAIDKMNILYQGIENPLTIAVAGSMPHELIVESQDMEIKNLGDGKFTVIPSSTGKNEITVSGQNFKRKTLEFLVKNVPDPIAVLNHKQKAYNGTFSPEEFKKSKGVNLDFNFCFNHEIDFEVINYSVVRVPEQNDPVEAIVRQADFSQNAQRLIDLATTGDTYYFDNIKVKYSMTNGMNEEKEMKLNSMVFKIE